MAWAPNPADRLGKLRELFFKDRATLRLEELKTVHQNRDAKFAAYVENYHFTKSGVLFIVAHIRGEREQSSHGPSAVVVVSVDPTDSQVFSYRPYYSEN